MRLKIYYDHNLRSYMVSKNLIEKVKWVAKFDYLRIELRHLLEKEYFPSCLVFWVLLILTRQRPANIKTWRGDFLYGFYVTLRGKQLYIFLDKFVNFMLPVGDESILTGYISEGLYTDAKFIKNKYRFSFLFHFYYKGIQEYFELLPFIYNANVTMPFLKDLRFFFSLSIFTEYSTAAVNLIHMCSLPLKFRV